MGFEKNTFGFEPKRKKIVIADFSIEDQARDIAEDKMTSSKEELRGMKGFFQKIWKHNLAREYYRQKEISKAKRSIQESGNLYIDEGGTKSDHEGAMMAIMERFQLEYDGESALRKGESAKYLQDSSEEKAVKIKIQDLVKDYASGKITEEFFVLKKDNLIRGELAEMRGADGEKFFRKNSLYADNLLEIAKQIKSDIVHGKGLDAIDLDFDILVGRAKAGVETKAQYNAVDRIIEKIQKSFLGRFANEATIASAVAIAYGIGVKETINTAQRAAKWVGPIGMALSAGVGGAVAAIREGKRIKEERTQHIREMAKGKSIFPDSERRREMDKFRYDTQKANDLTGNLAGAFDDFAKEPDSKKAKKLLDAIVEIESRVSFSERENVDTISFSDPKKVEQERTLMILSSAKAKVYIKNNLDQNWAGMFSDPKDFDDYLRKMMEEKIDREFRREKTLKDQAFMKMKNRKVAMAAIKGIGIGIGVGLVAQETHAIFNDSIEGGAEKSSSNGPRRYTSLEYIRRQIFGDLPMETVVKEAESQKIGVGEYINQREDAFSKIRRVGWADNDSLGADKNELKLRWGGDNNSGIDKGGNYVFNISHMELGGSSHAGENWDPQALVKKGKLKLLLSLSQDTQNHVIEIPIDENGNAIIDPKSEIGKIAFQNDGGHAGFLGRFAEIAVVEDSKDGINHVNILATHEGDGVQSVRILKDRSKTMEIPADYDVSWPYVVPIAGRKPLETAGKEYKQGADGLEEKVKKGMGGDETRKRSEELGEFNKFLGLVLAAGVAWQKKKDLQNEQKEKLRNLLLSLKKRKEDAAKQLVQPDKKVDYVRAAAWHTLRKLEESTDSNLNYASLDGVSERERNDKFLELTRKLWTELTVHGYEKYNPDTETWKVIRESDQDAYACLKLLELAGIKVDFDKVKFVEPGETAESGVIMDTSKKHGVISEEDGKRLIFDHHASESDRNTSSAKFVYETLIEMGLIERKEYLDNFVEFITKCDNLNFPESEMDEIYANYAKNLYGLHHKMKIDTVLELFKKGIDPKNPIPDDLLSNLNYYNAKDRKNEPLMLFSKSYENKMKLGESAIGKLEKDGFVVDTGDDRFGKILIDTKKNVEKGKWFPKVDGENKSNQLAAFLKGYGAYLLWSPKENSFVLYTRRKMDEDSFPGGLRQGFNMRGNMWIKRQKDPENLKINLEEIFSKLSGKDFKIEGKLKRALNADKGAKDMLSLFDEKKLTKDVLFDTANKLEVPLGMILFEMLKQRQAINKIYQKREEGVQKGKRGKKFNVLAMESIFEVQGSEAATSQPAPPKPEPPILAPKLEIKLVEQELRKIRNDFGVEVQGDQIMSEVNNDEIIKNIRESLAEVNRVELNDSIKMIALRKSSGVIGVGDKISLKYDSSQKEMTNDLKRLIKEAKEKQIESVKQKLSSEIPPQYLGIFTNFKLQMDKQHLPREAQKTVMDLLKRIVARDDLEKDEKLRLVSTSAEFFTDKSAIYKDQITSLFIEDEKLVFVFGSNKKGEPSEDKIEKLFMIMVQDL